MIWGESICVQVMLQRVGCWSSSKSFIMAFAEASIHSYSFVTRERRVPIKNILVIWSFHETFGAYIHSEMKQQITQDREDLFLVWSEFWFLTLTVVVCSKNGLGRFPKVRTGRSDHGWTGHFENEIGFFKEFLMRNDFLRAYYLEFYWSGWIALIQSKILSTMGMSWPVSSDKWKAPLVDFQGRDFRTSFQKSNKVELPRSEEPNLVPRVFSFSNITLTPTQIAKAIWEGMPISPGFWETREDPRYGFEESERQKKSFFTVCTAIIYSWFNKVALGITLWEAIFLVVSQENHCSEFRIFNAQLTTPENTINMPWWSLSPQNFT